MQDYRDVVVPAAEMRDLGIFVVGREMEVRGGGDKSKRRSDVC